MTALRPMLCVLALTLCVGLAHAGDPAAGDPAAGGPAPGGPPPGGPAAILADASRPLEARVAAAEALADSGDAAAVTALEAALKDPDKGIRIAALSALGRVGIPARTAREAIGARLEDPEVSVRAAAERALGKVTSHPEPPGNALLAFLALFLPGLAGALIVMFRIDDKRERLVWGIAYGSLGGVVAKALLTLMPKVSFAFDGLTPWIFIERDLAIPFGMVFFAAASRIIPEPQNKRAVKVLVAILAGVIVFQNLWVFRGHECFRKSDGVWDGGVCLQSTSFTCGAASIATVLRAEGVLDATEHECAYYSHTIPDRGVNDLGAAMALRRFLPGREVRIIEVSVKDLRQHHLPCLAPLNFSFWFDHMTVALAADEGGYWIGDPLKGRRYMTDAELEARWLGRAVVLSQPAPEAK